MKGYRTPSWFRGKERLKETQAKAQASQRKSAKKKKGKREVEGSPISLARSITEVTLCQ
jgi:hypothetical protein